MVISEAKMRDTLNGLIDEFMELNSFFNVWKTNFVDSRISEKFLVTFDFLVKSFPVLIAAGAARMENEETRTTLAVNLYQECGEGDVRRTHHAIFRNFLTTAGIDISTIAEKVFAVEWKKNLLEYIAGASSAPAALGALAAGEFLAQPVLGRIYSVIKPLYPAADHEYFTKHLELETEHVKEITLTLGREIGDDRQFREVLSGFKFGLSVWEDYFKRLTEFIMEKDTTGIAR